MMDELVTEFEGMITVAIELAGDFPHAEELGWSELMHDQKRRALQLRFLEVKQKLNVARLAAQTLEEEFRYEIDADRLSALGNLLERASNEENPVAERWEALETVCNQASEITA